MHARITTTCPSCGSVALDPFELTVVVTGSGPSWYLFDCLGCARQVVKDAPEAALAVLTRAEVAVHTVPAEVAERWSAELAAADRAWPMPAASTATLDCDALLDALLLLRSTDHLAALADRL